MKFKAIRFIDTNKDKALFFATLRKRVDGYFKENKISRNYNATMVIKTITLLLAYLIPFIIFLTVNPSKNYTILIWVIMGFAMAGIGMSIMHDANHGAYSSSQKVNYWLGLTLNLAGGSVFNWKIQHNVLHHTYTNITDYDDDIDDKLILKLTPHSQAKWYHKFQVVYAFAFYSIVTIYWAVLKDFLQLARYTKEGLNTQTKTENIKLWIKLILIKGTYLFLFLVMPTLFFKIAFTKALIGFLIMHVIAGTMLTVIFQLAHTVEGTSHPLPDENHTIENNWAVHQMNTTVNFSRNNKLISWYVGGLNYQVEHHLFPNICHVHYPQISKIVQDTANEFGVPYLENDSFMDAFNSHIKALARFGKLPNLDEAIG